MKPKKPKEILIEFLQTKIGSRITNSTITDDVVEYGRKKYGVAHSPMKYSRIFSILQQDKIELTNSNLSIKETESGTREKSFLIGEA